MLSESQNHSDSVKLQITLAMDCKVGFCMPFSTSQGLTTSLYKSFLLTLHFVSYNKPAMPASPITNNYTRIEQWAPLAVYGKRAPLRRKLRGQHKLTRKAPKTTRKATV